MPSLKIKESVDKKTRQRQFPDSTVFVCCLVPFIVSEDLRKSLSRRDEMYVSSFIFDLLSCLQNGVAGVNEGEMLWPGKDV